jgi:hypothetical protein
MCQWTVFPGRQLLEGDGPVLELRWWDCSRLLRSEMGGVAFRVDWLSLVVGVGCFEFYVFLAELADWIAGCRSMGHGNSPPV